MSMPAGRNRTYRRAWRSYALGVAAAAALLASTACEPGTSDAAGEAKSSKSASATSSATPSPTASAGAGDSGDDGSGVPLCTIEDLSVSAQNYDGQGEDVRHILLTVQNAGDHKCDVQGAPEVTLGDAQGPAPAKAETDSGEPITLAPGDEAYAGALATGGKMDTYDVTSMTLGLGSPGGESEAGAEVDVPMPVDSFPADDGQWVSYWQGTEGLAMRPVTQS
ncbi:DUF4232 domain-containing protein [Streptomyces sp. S3(2020)]|uniref:DUF4232 domain-containing protein n=1 Tax=Streptomyces sp. S3(2020) TaxID=2732044 RepID=UPI0014879E0D|nr:DUF4232 domain-containing protein [Streptomyces sp. S3(2020)]NNN34142.1 DUF4232 domain-containing protein [Streptomyces sp. S3(2020)]